ncbi:hypothetical protein [Streptomyces sp. NBRC 110611]|uniref:hypothetical protein n=1 Tax=Streptomyces sp. NBRC 110611 TaxID=1621259 RepID=UPI000B1D78D2|nr:hypothetical protein [Streptomyces sp. NBRC 110611]
MASPVTPDEANEAIRAFMIASVRRGRPLWPEEQDEYEQLLDAWAAAVRTRQAAT